MNNNEYFDNNINVIKAHREKMQRLEQEREEKYGQDPKPYKEIEDKYNQTESVYTTIPSQNLVYKSGSDLSDETKQKLRSAMRKGLAILVGIAMAAGAVNLEAKQLEKTNKLMDDYSDFATYTQELQIAPTKENYEEYNKYVKPNIEAGETIEDVIEKASEGTGRSNG